MTAVPVLSRLNAFDSIRWYPGKGFPTVRIVSCLTDRSSIRSFSSTKYAQKLFLIREEKLDPLSLSDGSHVAIDQSHIHSKQTTLEASKDSQLSWSLRSIGLPRDDHHEHLIQTKTNHA